MAPDERRDAPLGMTAVVLAIVAVSLGAALEWGGAPVAGPTAGSLRFSDLTPSLGESFHPGAIQGFGYNGTTVLLAGVSVWNKPIDETQPELVELTPGGSAINATDRLGGTFHDGGVFGTVWNGSTWMISGEGTWGTDSGGVLVLYHGEVTDNLTALVRPYFLDGGIWAVGWNGSSWLLAGNSSSGASLVSLQGAVVTDRTPLLPNNGRGDFIQLLVWNGAEWMVGGKGIFGTFASGAYHDLLPGSAFAAGGAYAADWNGSAWLVGGGVPAGLVVVAGDRASPGPALPSGFDRWASAIVATPAGWLVGGKGSGGATGSTPQLSLVHRDLRTIDDLSPQLPPPFLGGQVQFAGLAPWLGPGAILLVGQGQLNAVTGYSLGAMGVVYLPG